MEKQGVPEKEWISFAAAARLLGVNPASVKAMADRGALTVRRLPCCHPRVKRDQVVAMKAAAESSL